MALGLDVTEKGAAERMVGRAVGEFGRLDLLVNNAATAAPQPAESESSASFEHVLAVNVSAVFSCCQAAAAAMLPGGGAGAS